MKDYLEGLAIGATIMFIIGIWLMAATAQPRSVKGNKLMIPFQTRLA